MDRTRLELLYARYRSAVHRRCAHLLGSQTEADDALQEVFLRVLKYSDAQARDLALGYLCRVADRHCFDVLARRRRFALGTESQLALEALEERRTVDPRPERTHALAQVLAECKPRVREAALLYYVDEMTQEEVAEAMGVSRKTVKEKLAQFLAMARASLGEGADAAPAAIPPDDTGLPPQSGVKVPRARRARATPAAALAIAATVATAALLISTPRPAVHPSRSAPVLKGSDEPGFALVSGQGRMLHSDITETPLREGDVLSFWVSTPEPGYLFVADLDDRGRVSRFFPAEGHQSASVERTVGRVLPGTVILDDFVGRERIVLLYSRWPLAEDEVTVALEDAFQRAGRRLENFDDSGVDLPAHVRSATILKVPR